MSAHDSLENDDEAEPFEYNDDLLAAEIGLPDNRDIDDHQALSGELI